MNRLKIGVRLESFDLPLRRALTEASKLGVAGVQVDAVGLGRRLGTPLEVRLGEAFLEVLGEDGVAIDGDLELQPRDLLHVEIRDDGAGGARLDTGTGLLGLADRVAAFDGQIRVESQPGRGTLIAATLPARH